MTDQEYIVLGKLIEASPGFKSTETMDYHDRQSLYHHELIVSRGVDYNSGDYWFYVIARVTLGELI